MWTTESELLALTSSGLFGLPCTAAYQSIGRERGAAAEGAGRRAGAADPWVYSLQNAIDFDGGEGYLRVGSSCAPQVSGGRVDFRFESCDAKWRGVRLPLPPVGTGWFEVVYLDDEMRIARDSRGDLQICTRGA